MVEIRNKFIEIGGRFLISEEIIAQTVSTIRAFVFDWDGVFNNGTKGSERGSEFSEADVMGINMLRFNYWRLNGSLPLIFIITGENNKTAIELAQREHFNAVYTKFLHKSQPLQCIAEAHTVSFNEMAFVFDDILDINASRLCKLAFCVKRNASPLFKDFVIEQNACVYMSGNEGGNHAVREISELIIGLTGNYNETIKSRIEFSEEYKLYLSQRKAIETKVETAQ